MTQKEPHSHSSEQIGSEVRKVVEEYKKNENQTLLIPDVKFQQQESLLCQIYKITSPKVEGMKYIGWTSRSLNARWKRHISLAKLKAPDARTKFENEIIRIGETNFVIEMVHEKEFPIGTDRKVWIRTMLILETKEMKTHPPDTLWNSDNHLLKGKRKRQPKVKSKLAEAAKYERTPRHRRRGCVTKKNGQWVFTYYVNDQHHLERFTTLEEARIKQNEIFPLSEIAIAFIYVLFDPTEKDVRFQKIYIGETAQTLEYRRMRHVSQAKEVNQNNSNSMHFRMKETEANAWKIIPLFEIAGATRRELLALEAHVISLIEPALLWNSIRMDGARITFVEGWRCKNKKFHFNERITSEEALFAATEYATQEKYDKKPFLSQSYVGQVEIYQKTLHKSFCVKKWGKEEAKRRAEEFVTTQTLKRSKDVCDLAQQVWKTKLINPLVLGTTQNSHSLATDSKT